MKEQRAAADLASGSPLSQIEIVDLERRMKLRGALLVDRLAEAMREAGLPMARGALTLSGDGALLYQLPGVFQRKVKPRVILHAVGVDSEPQQYAEEIMEAECCALAASMPMILRNLADSIEKKIQGGQRNGIGTGRIHRSRIVS